MENQIIQSSSEIVYLNCSINNSTNNESFAAYDSTLNSPILKNINDYNVTLVRFTLPNTIPIMKFIEKKYYLTLTYQNQNHQFELIFLKKTFCRIKIISMHFKNF